MLHRAPQFLLVVLLVVLAGCGGLEDTLIGKKWAAQGQIVVEFMKDGKVIITNDGKSMSAKYTVIDDTRVLIEVEGVIGQLFGGDQLVYRASDGVLLKKDAPFLWPSEEARNAAKTAAKVEPSQNRVDENPAETQKQELAVRKILTSNLNPAQKAFKRGAYCDENGNSQGEYGTLGQLAACEGIRGIASSHGLTVPPYQGDSAYGYTFIVHLPTQVADRERFFVAYAYPTDGSGKSVYAMCQDGQVRVSPSQGIPEANTLFGGADWSVAPKWPVYKQ